MNSLYESLNQLLATYHIHYQKLRGCHWNVRGQNFFQLHLKFEELYNDALLKIDELAERILTLGGTPLSTFADYLQHSRVKEINILRAVDIEMVSTIAEDFSTLIHMEREILKIGEKVGDDGTVDMITSFIQFQEKALWMFKAWLAK